MSHLNKETYIYSIRCHYSSLTKQASNKFHLGKKAISNNQPFIISQIFFSLVPDIYSTNS